MLSILCNSSLNHKEIKKDPQMITKIKPFIDKYNWDGIDYPSEKDDCKKIEKNNICKKFKINSKKFNIVLKVFYAKNEKT